MATTVIIIEVRTNFAVSDTIILGIHPHFAELTGEIDGLSFFSVCYAAKKSATIGVIIGATVGGFILLVLLVITGMYAIRQRKRAKRATQLNDPFGNWKLFFLQCILCSNYSIA